MHESGEYWTIFYYGPKYMGKTYILNEDLSQNAPPPYFEEKNLRQKFNVLFNFIRTK